MEPATFAGIRAGFVLAECGFIFRVEDWGRCSMAPENLRIAAICLHSSPLGYAGTRDTGGMNVYIRELARELGKQGARVDVYTRVFNPGDENLVIELGTNSRLIHCRAGKTGHMDKMALYHHLSEFAFNVKTFAGNHRLRYDLIFSHYWLSGEAGRRLQHSWEVPHVIMFHTLGAVKNTSGAGESEPPLRIETERFLAGSCDAILAATRREKEDLIKFYGASPSKILEVPCGVNSGVFRIMDKKKARRSLGFNDRKIVLFVGRIDPIKGLDRLVAALGCLKDRQGVILVIAGGENNTGEMERIRAISREAGTVESIVFCGPVDHDMLPCFYNAAHVCAITSYSESFGMAALESLSCGTPVLATDVGNLKNIIRQGETGFVIDNPTPESIAEKLELLLSGPSLCPSFIRRSVSRYRWNRVAKALRKEFGRLV